MRYTDAVYFSINGEEDSFNVRSAKERDNNLEDMLKREEIQDIMWCRIYTDGSYGRRIRVVRE